MKETKDSKGLAKSKTHFDLFSLEHAMSGLAVGDNEQNEQEVSNVQPLMVGKAYAITAEEPSAGDSDEASGQSLFELLDERYAKSLLEQQQALKGLAVNGFLTHKHKGQPQIVSEVGNGLKRRDFSFK